VSSPSVAAASVVSQLKSLELSGCSGGGNDDDGATFDFRSVLKKTKFAPTASVRKRKGIRHQLQEEPQGNNNNNGNGNREEANEEEEVVDL